MKRSLSLILTAALLLSLLPAALAAEGVSLSEAQGAALSGPAELATQSEQGAGVDALPALSGGYGFTTALRSDGTVWAWGSNVSGQLGLGDETETLHPAAEQVPLPQKAQALASGAMHTLVAAEGNSHYVWGYNSTGQLGLGGTTDRSEPAYANYLSGHILSAGEQYSMSLYLDPNGSSTVYYWGYDIVTGTGSLTYPEKLTLMDGNLDVMPRNVSDISAGTAAALLLCRDGTVWTVGLGDTLEERQPRQVEGLPYITAISAGGNHFLALDQDGRVWTWGSNSCGQLGNGTTQDSATPVPVEGLSQVVSISAGKEHNAAVTANGALWTWGANASGQLGDATTQDSATPIQVCPSVTYAWAGYAHTFYADADGYLYGCGSNENGELGSGDLLSSAQFVPVVDSSGQPFSLVVYPLTIGMSAGGGASAPLSHYPAGATVTVTATPNQGYAFQQWQAQGVELADTGANPAQFTMPANPVTLTPSFTADSAAITPILTAGYTHTLLRNDGGTVYSWGRDSSYSLGTSHGKLPNKIDLIRNPICVDAGDGLSAFLLPDGTVWYLGELYQGGAQDTPTQLEGLSGITAIAVGRSHILALKEDGTVWGVGQNKDGCLTGEEAQITQPFQIEGLSHVTQIWAGYLGSAAKTEDGTVYVWGNNSSGQLGAGGKILSTPTPLGWDGDIRSLAIGASFLIALMDDGTVRASGNNSYGQLGNNAPGTNSTTPVQVEGLSGIAAVDAGSTHALAVGEDGTLWTWGGNEYGQLGIGTQTDSPIPVQAAEGVALAAAGGHFSVLIRPDGTLWASGRNDYYQLAIGADSEARSSFTPCQNREYPLSVRAYSVTIQAEEGGKVSCRSADRYLQDTADPVEQAYNFYLAGTPLTAEAVPDEGWLFDGWTVQGLTLGASDSTSLQFTVPTGPVVLTARFQRDPDAPILCPADGFFLADVVAPSLESIPIFDVETLAKIGRDPAYPLDGSYVLTDNLNLSAISNWTPIGTPDAPFTGTFDGNGHVVWGLTITYPVTDCTGLFGAAAEGATIKNLGVEQARIQLSGLSQGYVGILVGRLGNIQDGSGSPTLSNCYATGSVTVSGQAEGASKLYVGGLAGAASAAIQDCYNRAAVSATGSQEVYLGGLLGLGGNSSSKYGCQITRCFNEGAVSTDDTCTEANCGGLAGWLYGMLDVTQCRNTGAVTAVPILQNTEGIFCLGGIAGYCAASLENCYNQGRVDSGALFSYVAYSGGLAGKLAYAVSLGTSLINCYNSGDVSGGSWNGTEIGGLFGYAEHTFTPRIRHCVVACRYVDAYYNSLPGFTGITANIDSFALGGIGDLSFTTDNLYLSGLSNRGTSYVNLNFVEPIEAEALSKADTYRELEWDMDTLWTVDAQRNGGLPHFTWEYTQPVWISSYDRATATLRVNQAVENALLCAVTCDDRGRPLDVSVLAAKLEPGIQSLSLPLEQEGRFKLFLLDGDTLEPLCYPWSG